MATSALQASLSPSPDVPVPPLAPDSRPTDRLPYMPGLDGLRAIAVIAVLLYHSQDISGISSLLQPTGGFLGVEMFFVISGFLITALLIREHDATSTINLKSFWSRRARRLLPALYVFLAGTTALAALFATDAFDKIRREILGALFYFSNWLLIALDESYFEAAGRPSLLRHLWSLAIEEQFYLIWPPIVFAGLRWSSRRLLLAVTVIGAVGATVLLAVLFGGVEQYGDVTSVYYRTDARAGALLVGSALALAWQPWVTPSSRSSRSLTRRWGLELAGLASVAVLIAVQYFFTDRVIEWSSYQRLYRGGFLLVSGATALAIAAVSLPESRVGWLLGNPLLRWVGTRSYGLYLWHWPIFQLTRPRLDVDIDGYLLLGVRFALTAALVEVSYRLIEVPVRQRRFLATARTPRGIGIASITGIGLIAAASIVAATIPTIDRSGASTDVAASLPDTALSNTAPLPTPLPTPVSSPAPTPRPTVSEEAAAMVPGVFNPDDLVQPTPVPTPTQPPLPAPPPLSAPFDIASSQIHIVGDSVIEGAVSQLYRISPQVTINTRIGRQWWEVEGELRQMRAQGLANDVVVIQLGNNGPFNQQMFDGVMNALAGTRLVLFVNIHAPVVWEAEVNRALASNVNRYAENARLLDWYTVSEAHPEYFIEDGTHLHGSGMVALRTLIEDALRSLS